MGSIVPGSQQPTFTSHASTTILYHPHTPPTPRGKESSRAFPRQSFKARAHLRGWVRSIKVAVDEHGETTGVLWSGVRNPAGPNTQGTEDAHNRTRGLLSGDVTKLSSQQFLVKHGAMAREVCDVQTS